MLLPNGNSKKYIKTVIGIYILYVIVSPAISFATGHELKLDSSIYEEFFSSSNEYKSIQSDFESNNNKYVVDTYKEEIKRQIKNSISELGYYTLSLDFDVDLDKGEISNFKINIDDKEIFENSIMIEKIEIGNTIKKQENNKLSKQEIESIKKKIQEKFGIKYEDIRINSI